MVSNQSAHSQGPVLFFDRDVGTSVPRALRLFVPVRVEYHQLHFAQGSDDDVWMPTVGANGWVLIGHDKHHHTRSPELAAIVRHGIVCFYLWGANAPKWEKMRCFLNAYQEILAVVAGALGPMVYRIDRSGSLSRVL